MDFVPLSRITWPRARTTDRRQSQFKADYASTISLLERELWQVGANRVTMYAAIAPREVRLDGLPRSDAKATDPAVMLTFETRHGPVHLACDTYTDWKSNLRAIALTLEHLRAVERYGATKPGQQYKGYRPELPAKREWTDLDRAEQLLTDMAHRGGLITGPESFRGNPTELQRAYRAAMKAAHPDTGGSHQDAQAVNAAFSLLKGDNHA